ncbi:AraC family transcriptional regulator ligand-binding domain-containing protein [Steroidobacter flavus]|uniref:AraC family transcriptional regulator ligand-binding domain-containing protein n=1 Tax=Steroidobacter flavus TaxID=1842136 RepID=A0ABV8T1P1_9GAMM
MDADAAVIPLQLHPLGFIEAFTQLGANLTALLRGTGISHAMLDDPRARISYAQQARLIGNGLARCRQPGLGLIVGQMFDWSYYGTVGGVVQCSPSLRAAGEAFQRYLMIAQPWYAFRGRRPTTYLDLDGMIVCPLHCFPAGEASAPLRQFEGEFRLATQLRLWDSCGNKAAPDTSIHVCLSHGEPRHVHLYHALPCSSIRFDCARSYIAAHRHFVLEPFRPFRRRAFDRIIQRCEQELNESQVEPSYRAKVRWHVFAGFNKRPPLKEIASMLSVTPRALTRRLASEGATFRGIAHEVRMELTAHHLRCSHLSVDQIAELMGFSCASSLRRAIRNWSGIAAGAMRATPPEKVTRQLATKAVSRVIARS